jgi:hypothetical protein
MTNLKKTRSIIALAAMVLFTCSHQDTVTSLDDQYGFASVAPRLLYKNVATGNALPAGLCTTAIHIDIGSWDTTVSVAFSAHSMTVGNVPVGTGNAVLSCVDALGDTVFRGTSQLSLVKDIPAQPAVPIVPTDSKGIVLIITSPVPGLHINADKVTISGYAEAPAGIRLLTVKGGAATLNGNTFSSTVDLAMGSNEIIVLLQDNGTGVKYKPITVVRDSTAVDADPPQIIVSQPGFVNDTATIGTQSCQISGTVNDASQVIYFSVNGTQVIVDNANSWLTTLAIGQGVTPVRFEARDEKNNIQRDTLYVRYNPQIQDTTGPALTVSTPQQGITVQTGQINVSGFASDASGLKSITVAVNNGTPLTAAITNNHDFSLMVALDTTVTTNTIAVLARDTKDNESRVDRTITYDATAVDTTDPSVQIMQPANGYQSSAASITVRGNADDPGSGVSKITVLVDTVEYDATLNGLQWTATVTLTEGSHSIKARACDTKGNCSEANISVTYSAAITDTIAPVLSVTNPQDGITVSGSRITITGTAQDASAVQSVTVNGEIAAPASGSWSTYSEWEYIADLASGENTFTVSATDSSARHNATSITLHVIYTPSTSNNPPVTPSNPTPGNSGANILPASVVLRWNGGDPDSSDVVFYTVSLDTVQDLRTAQTFKDISANTFTITNLKFETKYYWRVVASDTKASTQGPVWSFTTGAPPIRPSVLRIGEVTESSIQLMWTQATDLVNFGGYRLCMSAAAGVPDSSRFLVRDITIARDTTFSVAGIPERTRKHFRIFTYNKLRTFAAASNEVDTITDFGPPPPATGLTAAWVGDDRAFVTWTAPNALRFTHYKVAVATDSTFGSISIFDSIPTVSHAQDTIEGLSPATNYWIAVRTYSDRVKYSVSAPIHIRTTAANRSPSAPFNPSPASGSTGLDTSFAISWSGGSDPDTDTVSFDIYRGTDSSNMVMIIAGWTSWSYDFCCMRHGTQYYWRVVAKDNRGASSHSAVWRFTTRSAIVNRIPLTPVNPSPSDGATGTDTSLTVQWSGGDPDSGDTVFYTIFRGFTTATMAVIDSGFKQTSYGFSGMARGTQYFWKIEARDNHGASISGPTWSFTTKSNSPPNVPKSPYPRTDSVGVDTGFTAGWVGGDPDAGDIVSYDVYCGTDSSNLPVALLGLAVPQYRFCCRAFDTKYYWRIDAHDNHGHLTVGPVWSFTTQRNPDWQLLPGVSSFVYGLPSGNFSYGFALDSGEAPVVAYPDGSNSGNVVVKRLDASSGTWNRLGPYLSGSYGINLVIDPISFMVFVAHSTGASGMPALIDYLNAGSSTWSAASNGMPTFTIPLGAYQYEIPLAASQGKAYLVSGTPSPFQIFQYTGGLWQGFMAGLGDTLSSANSVAIAVKPSASPFMAYLNSSNNVKTIWNNSGSPYDATPSGGFFDADTIVSPYLRLDYSSGPMKLAYRMNSANNNKAAARVYANGSSWSTLGGGFVSDGPARDLALASDPITVACYLAYVDQTAARIVVRKLAPGAASWTEIGNSSLLAGGNAAYELKLCVNHTGSGQTVLYLAYLDNSGTPLVRIYSMADR